MPDLFEMDHSTRAPLPRKVMGKYFARWTFNTRRARLSRKVMGWAFAKWAYFEKHQALDHYLSTVQTTVPTKSRDPLDDLYMDANSDSDDFEW